MNKLMFMLQNEVDKIKSQLLTVTEIIKTYNYYIDTFSKIVGSNNEVNNLNYMININVREMFQKLDIDSSELLTKLVGFQKFVNSAYYPLSDTQKNECIKIFNNLSESVLEKLNSKLEEEKELSKILSRLESVLDKLNNDELDRESYDVIYDYLKRDDIVIENKLELLISLTIKLNSKVVVDKVIEDEIIEEVPITNLDLEAVIELFNKYGYDFNNISKDVIKDISPSIDYISVSPAYYILQLGNYNNIEGILKAFRDNSINIDFNKYSNQLCKIFVLSNSNNVLQIINNIKDDLSQNNRFTFEYVFSRFIKCPTMFINGKKNHGKRRSNTLDNSTSNDSKNNMEKDSNIIVGQYNNYCANRKLLLELGVDIVKSFDDCFCVFGIANDNLKNNITLLETYGIEKEQYVKALSVLSSSPLQFTFALDRFIELGSFNLGLAGYEHIKNNLSNIRRSNEQLCSIVFSLINAIKAGYSMSDLFHTTFKGEKYMSLCAKFLHDFPCDTIYELGQPVELKEYNIEYSPLKDINFDVFDLPFSSTLFENFYIKKLEELYKIDDLRYNINGVIISRNKVLRNANILLKNAMLNARNMMYVLTRDSILTIEQFGNVLCFVNELMYNDSKLFKGGK